MIEFLLRYSKRDGSMWSEEEWRVILEKCRQDLVEKIEGYRYYTLDQLIQEKKDLNNLLIELHKRASSGLSQMIEHNSLSNMFSIST